MLKSIKKFIAPPIFENDEDKTRTAALLNAIVWFLLFILVAVNILISIVNLIGGQAPLDVLISLIAAAMFVGMLALIHQGFVRGMSYLLAFTITGIILFSVGRSPTVNAATLSGLLLSVMTVGLLTGGRAAMIVSAVNLFGLYGLGYLYDLGWATLPPLGASQLITFGAIFILSALLLGLAFQSIQEALLRARHHQQELAALAQSLEQRVAERTKALATSTEISRRLSSILNEQQLIIEVVEQVKTAFGYYHIHIYLLDETTGDLMMAGGTGDVGAAMLASGHKILKGKGLVGRVAETNVPVLVSDTAQDPSWLPNPLLPETVSEAAVPIAVADKLVGVLDVQHNQVDGLSQEDMDLLQSIANQVGIALLNARTYTAIQQRADRESRITSIGQRIQSTTSIEGALQVVVRELGRTLGANDIQVILDAPGLAKNNRKPA
jgi:putative methionine-R-sulfoxide reductase with GAF domain